MSNFSPIKSKQVMLTYPHCTMTKEDCIERLTSMFDDIIYIIVSEEKHQDGTPHLHAYIKFENEIYIGKKSMDIFDLLNDETGGKWHPNIQRVKSPKDAIKYVKKDGNFITKGICPYHMALSCKEKNALLMGNNLQSLVEEGNVSIYKIPQLFKAIQIIRNEQLDGETQEVPKVRWYYGPTGSGKTRTAIQEAEVIGSGKYWKSNSSGTWFDGYNGEKCVILDDIRASTWPFQQMLQLTDRYRLQVPIKGSFRRWNPSHIWITAPGRPEEVYYSHGSGQVYDGIEQLLRRIGEENIISFPPTCSQPH